MSLTSAITSRATLAPQSIAMIGADGGTIEYAELQLRVERTVALLEALGVGPGDRIAVLGRNHPSQLVLVSACAACGAVACMLNWRLSESELALALDDAAPLVLFAGGSVEAAAAALSAGRPPLSLVQSPSEDLLDAASRRVPSAQPAALPKSETGDLLLCFTSGSSGRPKGVRITHANLEAAAVQARQQVDWGWSEASVSLCVLPLFHIAGLRAALFPLRFGGTSVFVADAQPATVLRALATHRVSKLSIVPTLLGSVLREPTFPETDLSSLQTVFYGGAPMPAPLLQEVSRKLRCDLVQIYGLTETCGAALALGPDDHTTGGARLGSCGRPLPGLQLRMVEAGEVGAEVFLKGPTVCAGYWRREPDNATAFSDDGWFRTGDLGHLDDEGYLHLRGRAGDVIKSGGEKVLPTEVEQALLKHPAVLDAGVVGVSDPHWGERVAAGVVLAPGARAEEFELMAHCRHLIGGFKSPKQVRVMTSLPRNANGKLVRAELRRLLAQGDIQA